MQKFINNIFSLNKYFLIPIFITLLSSFLITATFFILKDNLPPKIPLFYSLSWGKPQLVDKQQFLILPAVLLLFCLVNTLIASQLHHLQVVLIRTLMLSLILLDLIILITTFKILTIFI